MGEEREVRAESGKGGGKSGSESVADRQWERQGTVNARSEPRKEYG